jgi:hypothetical protein
MRNKIEEKIRQLKDRYFDVSTRKNWVRETNGISQEETKFKLQSQLEILEELLNQNKNE